MDANHNDEEAIYYAALEQPPTDRTAYLKRVCGENADLLTRLEALIAIREDKNNLLESPPFIGTQAVSEAENEKVGTIIDRYKLLEKIGEGGMATVYMAEQAQPIRRRVALKVIKLGMDTKEVIARFEAERQALAIMDHPNVAKVHDAGSTETGRPYFVMELVRGVSITEYCDKNNLSTQERLELFIPICQAIQHAHQKGIIHRDIKPSNVMVTLHDGKPVPKVIDFGIAKATNQRLTEKTLFTKYAQMIGTPEYISPEQAEMSSLDIDTRTDIYSLGVLLYELLTGTTPVDAKILRKAGYLEMQRIIREEEPTKPSTKLSTLGKILTDVAKHRKTNPEALCKLVRGDLDWIVMKAMEKDRTRRYATAVELVDDIERNLNNEPVLAAAPSLPYKLGKFIRRNRAGVVAGSLILVALLIGFVGTMVGFFRAEANFLKSEENRQRAETNYQIAETQRRQTEDILARSQIERGVRHLNEGDSLGLFDLVDAQITAKEIPEIRDTARRLWAIGYDLYSDRLVQVLPGGQDLAISPDGKLLAVAQGKTAQLWDLETGQPHGPSLQLSKRISVVLFSPDGELLVTHSFEGAAQLWNPTAGERVGPVLQLEMQLGKDEDNPPHRGIFSAAFSPDGRILATAFHSGKHQSIVQLWRTDTCESSGQPIQDKIIYTIAFSPDGKLLATGTRYGQVRLWNVQTGESVSKPLRHGSTSIRKVTFSPSGKYLASASGDGTCFIWELATGQAYKTLPHSSRINNLLFSPNGKLLVTASADCTAQFWDPRTGEKHGKPLEHPAPVMTVSFSPGGKLLATSSRDGTVRLWNVDTGKAFGQSFRHHIGITEVEFSPDGEFLASTTREGTTRIWKTHPQLVTDAWSPTITQRTSSLSPNGKVWASKISKTMKLRDVITGTTYDHIINHGRGIMVYAFSPCSNFLATGGMDWTIRLWEIDSGQLYRELSIPDEGTIYALAFSPNGKMLAVATDSVWVFEISTERCLHTFRMSGNCYGLAFHPNGNILAVASSNSTVFLWDVTAGQLVNSIPHRSPVRTVAFNRSGNILATAVGVQATTVWFREISLGPPYYALAFPYPAALRKLIFHRQEGLVISGTDDKTSRLWRLPIAPSNQREIQLLTWVALGIKREPRGILKAIPLEQWQIYREELCAQFESTRVPKLARTEPSKNHYDKPKELPKVREPLASHPEPADGTDIVIVPDATLKWTPGLDAIRQQVYWGVNPQKLKPLAELENASKIPLPALEKKTWYCWRVDTVKSDNSIVKGKLWSFSTGRLIGWWKFDETEGNIALDSSGFDHDGMIMGDTQRVPGRMGRALQFDGDSDYVDCGSDSDFDLTDAITVAAWIKVDAFHGITYSAIVSKGSDAWRLQRHLGVNILSFQSNRLLYDATKIENIDAHQMLHWQAGFYDETALYIHSFHPVKWKTSRFKGNIEVNDGKWHHVVGVYDGTRIYQYMDGVLENDLPALGRINIEKGKSVYIGGRSDNPRWWNGWIDDVRIYSYGLSADEVASLYGGQGPGPLARPKWLSVKDNEKPALSESQVLK